MRAAAAAAAPFKAASNSPHNRLNNSTAAPAQPGATYHDMKLLKREVKPYTPNRYAVI
jgi:hypothetical protein